MNLWHILSLIGALFAAGLFWWTNHQDPPAPPEVRTEIPDASVIPESRGVERSLRFGP